MAFDDVEKYANSMLETFSNDGHKKEVREYLFIREKIDKVGKYTRRNDVQALATLDQFLGSKQYNQVTQDVMLRWETFLQKEIKLKPSTIEQYESHVKRFYKYLNNKKEYKKGKRFQKNIPYPDSVSWISMTENNNNKLPLDRILTQEELLRMLDTCENLRDQAMVISFIDAGLRNSELLSLNIESVGFDKLGCYFILPKNSMADLKTGMRKIRLFLVPSSAQYLKNYINNHPFKRYTKCPLFISRDPRWYSKVLKKVNSGILKEKEIVEELGKLRMSRVSVKDIIKNIAKRANAPIGKPHDLRHNSCTMASKAGFNEMELRIRYGWSPTSKMPSRYTHLASKDLEDKIKVITGFKEPDKKEDAILQPIICWNCKEENIPTAMFCNRCGGNLNPTKEEITATATETGIATQDMLKDPEFREYFNDMLALTWEKYMKKKESKN